MAEFLDPVLDKVAAFLREQGEVSHAQKIEGESSIGVEATNGGRYFLTLESIDGQDDEIRPEAKKLA
jgi:hypothetical protein